MRIGMLGSGLMGGTLGTIFSRAGHQVVFSYARSDEKLRQLAQEAGGTARAAAPGDAAGCSDVLLLAVHWSTIDDVLRQAGDLSGRIVLTCSLPMNADNTALVVGHTSSGAEQLAARLPASRIVSAFNTVPSEVLLPVYDGKHAPGSRPGLVYCGDDREAMDVAAALIRDVGFDPVDAGPLRVARYTEPFALLVGQLAYDTAKGPALAYRFERLAT